MNEKLTETLKLVQQSGKLSEEEKNVLMKSLKDADKELAVSAFKIDRLEKVKHTTTVLLEQTIEELEAKRKSVEQQKRDLEIEASLERVRTIAMGMRKPTDMLDICQTISHELQLLGVKEVRNVQTAIFYEEKGTYMNYEFYVKHDKSLTTEVSYKLHPAQYEFAFKMLQGPDEFFTLSLEGQKLKDWYEYQKTTPQFVDTFLESASSLNYYWYSMGPVALGLSTYAPLSEEQVVLFKRFRNVFELSYRRYLDIEKAEAQAREAKIEASLEKVRSRSLAMHKSDELPSIARTMFDQLKGLGLELEDGLILMVFKEGSNDQLQWPVVDGVETNQMFLIPEVDDPILKKVYEARANGVKFIESHFDKAAKDAFLDKVFTITDYRVIPVEFQQRNYAGKYYHYSFALEKYTGILMHSYNRESYPEEYNEIIRRFARVFEQAYVRFLDLKKAEAQARESQIQLALERVRARTMAMQKSDELKNAAALLFQQVKALGVPAYSCGYNIWEKGEKEFTSWMSTQDGSEINAVYNIPLTEDANFIRYVASKEKGESFFVLELRNERMQEHYEYLKTIPAFKEYFDYAISVGFVPPDTQIHHIANFSKGNLLFITLEPCPEYHDVFRRFAGVFEQTYTRFLDLQKAEAQAHESQIQLALERVRARTMAMHNSNELGEVAVLLFEQVKMLGIETYASGFNIWDEEHDKVVSWMSNPTGSINPPFEMPIQSYDQHRRIFEAWENKEAFLEDIIFGEDMVKHYRFLRSFPLLDEAFNRSEAAGIETPVRQVHNVAFFSKGYLLFITQEPQRSLHEIFVRFAKVFEQTYTRFLDLQKAEAQAREAQIEAGLERVRSRAMGMQSSEELKALIGTVFTELTKLDLVLTRCVIWVFDPMTNGASWWMANIEDPSNPISFFLKYHEHPAYLTFLKEWKSQSLRVVYDLKGQDKIEWDRILFNETELRNLPDAIKEGMSAPDRVLLTASFNNFGALNVASLEPLSDDHFDILLRFAKVFDLTYTRFLDLQKAESQAREAKIQLALERVRARTMAMQHSDELADAAYILFQQFKQLGEDPIQITIGIFNEEKNVVEFSITAGKGVGSKVEETFVASVDEPTLINKMFKAWKQNKKSEVIGLQGQELADWIKYRNALNGKYAYETKVEKDDRRFVTAGFFSKGLLSISTTEVLSEESTQILERFAAVFELTYTRFLDLKHAEAQARESRIEAALEKVRSRTLAMQHSDELAETAAVLFQQLINLGIEPNRLYIGIAEDDSNEVEFWITDEDGSKVSTMFKGDAGKNLSMKKMVDAWRGGEKSIVIDMQGKQLEEYFHYLGEQLHVPFKGGLAQKRRLQYIAFFSKGFIGMASPEEQRGEVLELLERFAYVFNLTFTRFNDLKIAEAHALQAEQDLVEIKEARRRAEEALKELKATQAQLIQSEKMASLGELTAGIAHEIQNPLNFVNNFSEVSTELLDEIKMELDKGDVDEVKAIVEDVKQNLEKIAHHGKRADGIVKSMLQHSRKGSGQKDLVDINALVDEYLRMSYHGFRAKDKSFNAILETHFDPEIKAVSIIGQDIGRVLLNLFNNAFYAVNERKKAEQNGFDPTIQVTTTRLNKAIEIRVKDNGTGIPGRVLEKIYQPFFTTKPTGEGTGLGLSLSYDIITKGHGGDLKVETKELEGTEFIIQLPNSSTL